MNQTQEELICELTLSALNHWARTPGKKPANLLATGENSLAITSAIASHIQQTGRKPDVNQVDKIIKELGDKATGGKLYYHGSSTTEELKKAKKDKFEREAAAGFHQERKNQRTELDRPSVPTSVRHQ